MAKANYLYIIQQCQKIQFFKNNIAFGGLKL